MSTTIESLCKVLGVELWELFYTGDKSLMVLQAEIHSLKAERDALLEENGALKNQVDTLSAKVDSLRDKNDALKDQLIETHNYYIKQKTNNRRTPEILCISGVFSVYTLCSLVHNKSAFRNKKGQDPKEPFSKAIYSENQIYGRKIL